MPDESKRTKIRASALRRAREAATALRGADVYGEGIATTTEAIVSEAVAREVERLERELGRSLRTRGKLRRGRPRKVRAADSGTK